MPNISYRLCSPPEEPRPLPLREGWRCTPPPREGGVATAPPWGDGALKAPPEYSQETIINGDELIPIISLASIAAKVTRDRLMVELSKKYPEYSFEKHKGYGTAAHYEALKKHGPCDIHRRSFLN